MIREALARQPDAAYLLVQRVLQLEIALRDATAPKAGFVGDANAWGRAPVASQPPAPGRPVPMQQSPVQQAPSQQAPAPPMAARGGFLGGGMMGTVASAAVGVVAGSLLAQGIGSMFGQHNKAPDQAATPPGGGTLVENDYGASRADDGGYAAEDFESDAGGNDSGDVG